MFRQAGKPAKKPNSNPPELQLVMLQLLVSAQETSYCSLWLLGQICAKNCAKLWLFEEAQDGEKGECVWSCLQSLSKSFWVFASQNMIVSVSSCAWFLDSHPPKHWFNGLGIETHSSTGCSSGIFFFVTVQRQSKPVVGNKIWASSPPCRLSPGQWGRLCLLGRDSVVWDIHIPGWEALMGSGKTLVAIRRKSSLLSQCP